MLHSHVFCFPPVSYSAQNWLHAPASFSFKVFVSPLCPMLKQHLRQKLKIKKKLTRLLIFDRNCWKLQGSPSRDTFPFPKHAYSTRKRVWGQGNIWTEPLNDYGDNQRCLRTEPKDLVRVLPLTSVNPEVFHVKHLLTWTKRSETPASLY